MLKLYLLSTLVLLVLILPAFLKDSTAPKTSIASWGFFLFVLGLSPMTLPVVLYHRSRALLNHQLNPQSEAAAEVSWRAGMTSPSGKP